MSVRYYPIIKKKTPDSIRVFNRGADGDPAGAIGAFQAGLRLGGVTGASSQAAPSASPFDPRPISNI